MADLDEKFDKITHLVLTNIEIVCKDGESNTYRRRVSYQKTLKYQIDHSPTDESGETIVTFYSIHCCQFIEQRRLLQGRRSSSSPSSSKLSSPFDVCYQRTTLPRPR